MILIDNVELDLKGDIKEGTPMEKFVKQQISFIKKEYANRFPLIITYGQHLKYKQTIEQGGREMSVEKYPPLRVIKPSCHIMLNGVKTKIQWCVGKNDQGVYYPVKENFKGKMIIHESDVDKAFYYLMCYPNLSGGLEVKEIEKLGVPKDLCDFHFMDTHKENRQELEYMKIRSKVENSISNEMTDESVKKACINYGIAGSTSKPAEVLRPELTRLLDVKANMTNDKISVYNEFQIRCEKIMTNVGTIETQIRSLIQKCTEAKYIKQMKDRSGIEEWAYFNPKTGGRGKRIHQIMPDKAPIESLVAFLLSDEVVRNEMELYYNEQTKK